MRAEFEQSSKEQVEGLPLKIQPGKPTVVDSEFVLQVHFGQGALRLGLPAKIGIFALSQTQIQREDAKVKQAKSQKPVGKVTFLSLSFSGGKILIGETNVVFESRTFDSFDINIQSLTPVKVTFLNHDLDVIDKSEAQSILNPDWFQFSLRPATEEDIKDRKRFEITRALKNFQKGAVTSVEVGFLKRKKVIPYTHSRFRRHK